MDSCSLVLYRSCTHYHGVLQMKRIFRVTIDWYPAISIWPSKIKKLVSVPARHWKSARLDYFFISYFHSFSLKMFQYCFATAKTWSMSELVIRKLMFSAFHYDVYAWDGMSEHLDARTTISSDMFYLHHPTLLATTCCLRLNTMLGHVGQCWIMLEDVGWSLISVKLFIQHWPTFFFEHAHLWPFTSTQSLHVHQSEGIVIPEGTALI